MLKEPFALLMSDEETDEKKLSDIVEKISINGKKNKYVLFLFNIYWQILNLNIEKYFILVYNLK